MKTFLKIVGVVIGIIIAFIIVELATSATRNFIMQKTWVESYRRGDYSFRINGCVDYKINQLAKNKDNEFISFSDSTNTVYLMMMRIDKKNDEADRRLTYQFVQKLDTMCFNLRNCVLESDKHSWFSFRTTRTYAMPDGNHAKTVSIYAGKNAYVFMGTYVDKPLLMDNIVNDFKSSKTGGISAYLEMWRDRISNGNKVWNTVLYIVIFLLKILIVFGLFFLFIKVGEKIPDGIISLIFFIIGIFLIVSFVCLYEDLMNWIMGFGPFYRIILGVIIFFIGDGE